MCNQEEEVSEHLVAKRLESKEEILEVVDKYQWAIVQLKLMSEEQKLLVLEAMEQQMSSKEWRMFQEERQLSILKRSWTRGGWPSTR